jgi:hypothetical protein
VQSMQRRTALRQQALVAQRWRVIGFRARQL